MARTPHFVIIPERTALAGAGATGCAVGSHAWSGYIPALQPKPIIIPKYTTLRKFSCPIIATGFKTPPAVKVVVSPYIHKKKKPIRPRPAPNIEYPRYLRPAAIESWVSV